MFTDHVNRWATTQLLNGGPGSGRHAGFADLSHVHADRQRTHQGPNWAQSHPTQNEGYGFSGTVNTKKKTGDQHWNEAMDAILPHIKKLGGNADHARAFLDSAYGRHFADSSQEQPNHAATANMTSLHNKSPGSMWHKAMVGVIKSENGMGNSRAVNSFTKFVDRIMANPGLLVNAGNSDGAKKGWEQRQHKKEGGDWLGLSHHHANGQVNEVLEDGQTTIHVLNPKGVKHWSATVGDSAPAGLRAAALEHAKKYVERGLHNSKEVQDILANMAGVKFTNAKKDEEEEKPEFTTDDDKKNKFLNGVAMPITGEKVANSFVVANDGWIQVAPYGVHPHPSGLLQVIDKDAVSSMVNTFNERKTANADYAPLIDRDHKSANTQETGAAGWVQNLEQRDDGMWAKPVWTNSGEKDVTGGEFRYTSPVWNRSDCVDLGENKVRPVVFDSLALTNNPNLGVKAITHLT